jgi:hypothetical protein
VCVCVCVCVCENNHYTAHTIVGGKKSSHVLTFTSSSYFVSVRFSTRQHVGHISRCNTHAIRETKKRFNITQKMIHRFAARCEGIEECEGNRRVKSELVFSV